MNENDNMTAAEKRVERKREIIKTIAIIFLTVLLVLTFFSRTIMNRSLAEVTTQAVSAGKLTEKIQAAGMIQANETCQVTTEEERVIEKIHIRKGTAVKKGDILFTAGSAESLQLTAAEKELDSLKTEYRKMLIREIPGYAAEDLAIKNAREDLAAAVKERDSAAVKEAGNKALLPKIESMNGEITRLTEKKARLEAALKSLDTGDYTGGAPEYCGDIAAVYGIYKAAEEEYRSAYALYSSVVENGGDTVSAKGFLDEKDEARRRAEETYLSTRSAIRSEVMSQFTATEAELADCRKKLREYNSAIQQVGASSAELEASVTAKERELERLLVALGSAQSSDEIKNQIAGIDLENKKKAVEAQENIVSELRERAMSLDIKSPGDGTVISVDIKVGETAAAGVPIAVIDISEAGYTVSIDVEAEQAEKVSTGARAQVIGSAKVEAVLTEIKTGSVDKSKKTLVFDVTGNAEAGSFIELYLPCGTGNYESIVPRSAVRTDNEGSFVFTVTVKSSVFGSRYFVRKVPVMVAASDEKSSAVEGGLSAGEYVVTASGKPIASGDQVRLNDK